MTKITTVAYAGNTAGPRGLRRPQPGRPCSAAFGPFFYTDIPSVLVSGSALDCEKLRGRQQRVALDADSPRRAVKGATAGCTITRDIPWKACNNPLMVDWQTSRLCAAFAEASLTSRGHDRCMNDRGRGPGASACKTWPPTMNERPCRRVPRLCGPAARRASGTEIVAGRAHARNARR